jgi:hypothetical protein
MSDAGMMFSPDAERISFPFSRFVPSSRTTSGTGSPTPFAAATTPSAMTSHRMIPPKMFTKIALTFGSDRMRRKACVTCSVDALPPTSRKFAGAPPQSLIMSMVVIASPAPFTRQPMFPSRRM